MKNINFIPTFITASLIASIASTVAQAQGSLYLSNLGQPSEGGQAVAKNSSFAQSFFTGTNSGGYILNSIQLSMGAATHSPSGFSISIYNLLISSSAPFYIPGNNLGTLSGSTNPVTAGTYNYTTDGITLLPSSSYFIVVSSATTEGSGYYYWMQPNNGNIYAVDNWTRGGSIISTDNGLSWSRGDGNGTTDPFQFDIYATPVPEPSFLSLLALGGLVCLCHHRKAKQS